MTSSTINLGMSPWNYNTILAPGGGFENQHDEREIFPITLYRMLETVEKDGRSWIVSWDPHGRFFTVHKPKVFSETMMREFFHQTKFKSFLRQLNLYRFNRIAGLGRKQARCKSPYIFIVK